MKQVIEQAREALTGLFPAIDILHDIAKSTGAAVHLPGLPSIIDKARAALASLEAAAGEPSLTLDQRYWLDRRAAIIEALRVEGFEIWSDKDRVWLHRISASLPAAADEGVQRDAMLTDAYAEGRKDEREDLEKRGILIDCSACNGIGERPVLDTSMGPDAGDGGIQSCPECDGTGYAKHAGDMGLVQTPVIEEAMRRALGDIISQTIVTERMGYTDPQKWEENSQRIRQIARATLQGDKP